MGFSRQEYWSGLPFPSPMQEMRVQSLGQEEPLEKKQSSIVAWKIPWTEEPGGLQSMGSPKSHTQLSN